MCLQLDNTRFDIVGLRPAGLLVDELGRIVTVHVVSRATLPGRILALVLIAYTSTARQFTIAFTLPLTAWVGISGWSSRRAELEQAEDSHGAQAALLR